MSLFSDRFRQLKDERNLTLKDISKDLGISTPNLSYYMNGREPSYDILMRIAHYFHVSTDWLIGYTDTQNIEQDVLLKIVEENEEMLKNKAITDSNLKSYYLQCQQLLYKSMNELYEIMAFSQNTPTTTNIQSVNQLLESIVSLTFNFFSQINSYYGLVTSPRALTDYKDLLDFINCGKFSASTISVLVEFLTLRLAENMCYNSTQISTNDSNIIFTLIKKEIERLEIEHPPKILSDILKSIQKYSKN